MMFPKNSDLTWMVQQQIQLMFKEEYGHLVPHPKVLKKLQVTNPVHNISKSDAARETHVCQHTKQAIRQHLCSQAEMVKYDKTIHVDTAWIYSHQFSTFKNIRKGTVPRLCTSTSLQGLDATHLSSQLTRKNGVGTSDGRRFADCSLSHIWRTR